MSNSNTTANTAIPAPSPNACVTEYIYIGSSWWAPKSLYNEVLYRLRDIIGGMQPGALYTLKVLYGPEDWDRLSEGDRRTAGRCVPHMLARGLLPEIEIAEAKRTSRLRYRLKHEAFTVTDTNIGSL